MIPHHSIAIRTSENAHITDPGSNGIIHTEEKDIAEMKALSTALKQID